MKTKNFRKKISLACGDDNLRPVMQNISFDDGFAIATDAHLLVKQSLKAHGFTEDEISIMNGKFLHKEAFNEVFRYDMVIVTEDGFICRKSDVRCVIAFSDLNDCKYPNWKDILPDTSKDGSLSQIGMNVNLLKKVQQITLSYSKQIKFRFSAANNGVVLTPIDSDLDPDDEFMLLMPVRID